MRQFAAAEGLGGCLSNRIDPDTIHTLYTKGKDSDSHVTVWIGGDDILNGCSEMRNQILSSVKERGFCLLSDCGTHDAHSCMYMYMIVHDSVCEMCQRERERERERGREDG